MRTAWDEALGLFSESPGDSLRGPETVSDATRAGYVAALRRFADRVERGPWEVDEHDVDAWVADASSASGRRSRTSALRAFYSWALRAGHTPRPPMDLPAEWLYFGRGWDEALRAFERHLAIYPAATTGRPLATATRQTYLVYLRRFARDVEQGPWEVDVDQVEAWRVEQRLTGDGPQKARLALQVFYSWAVMSGRRRVSPVELPAEGLGDGWAEAIDGFAAALATSDRSPATQATYVQHVRWTAAAVKSGPGELEVHELQQVLDAQRWSVTTRRKVLYSLKAFYRWAVEHDVARWSPLAGLQSPEHARRGPERARIAPSWEEPLEAFVRWLRAGKRTEGTIDLYRHRVHLLSQLASDPWQVTTKQLELWIANPDWSAETARSARSVARTFYAWAVRDGRLDASPAADIGPVRSRRALPRPTSDDALQEALRGSDDRTRLILVLAALAGLRRAEIAALHTSDVSPEQIYVKGKGGRDRALPTHPTVWAEVSAELERRRRGSHGSGFGGPFCSPDGYLFPSDLAPAPLTPAHVGRLATAVLPGAWTLHTLRHRFATKAYGNQRDLLAVQHLLGHSKPETTAIYAQVPDGATRSAVLGISL